MRFRGLGWTTNRVLEKLKGRRISSLELFGTSADDDLLIELSRQGRLTSLDISSDQITDRGVRAIVSSCNLRSLIFSACSIRDR